MTVGIPEVTQVLRFGGLPEANWRVVKNADNSAWWATVQYFAMKLNLRRQKFSFVQAITPIDEGNTGCSKCSC